MRTIEVFADVMCPFAYVGLHAFDVRRRDLGVTGPMVAVRAWPLEVVNGTPHDGHHLAGEIAALRRDVVPHLFAGFHAEGFPTSTRPALAATAAAYRHDAEAGERFALAVRHALWEQGQDVSDADILAALAEQVGVPVAAAEDDASVDADLAEGRARGVSGSPHWFTDQGDFFCPSLEIHHEGDEWDVRFDREGFDRFLTAALG
jgi:predicted DsbA family dithiol-disulfide isomerase